MRGALALFWLTPSGPLFDVRARPAKVRPATDFAIPAPANDKSSAPSQPGGAAALPRVDWRLHRHADYQRVYQSSRKQFVPLMAYFVTPRRPEAAAGPARVGLTAGRVLGKAVERNRIKRRMRAAVRGSFPLLPPDLDVVLHPRRQVLDAPFSAVCADVERIFRKASALAASGFPERPSPAFSGAQTARRRRA